MGDVYSKQGAKFEIDKQRLFSRKNFPSDVNQELDGLQKDLADFDPDFSAEIIRQLGNAMAGYGGGNYVLRVRYARSFFKAVKSGDQMGMLLVTEMLAVHDVKMIMAQRLKDAEGIEETETYGNLYNKLARTFATQIDTLQRWCSGPQLSLQYNVSVNDGGQAIVGNVTQNAIEKGQPAATTSPLSISDESGMAMPIVEHDDQGVATAPLIEQDQEPAPIVTRRRRRK